MIRLVYAPKAYAFIRSSNTGGRIYDVSEDIVEGEVNRVVNDVSTARIVLRNRKRRYIRTTSGKNKGSQVFLPMDLITIWLQRIAGKPVQVFTGYLDSVPYFQLYPGNCQVTATCTLKKLAYTWFDPGLPFFINWVRSHDWIYDPTTGDGSDPNTLWQNEFTFPKNSSKKKTNDGGFGRLLYDFMTQIAGWPGSDVLVSNLDPNLPKKAAELFVEINRLTESEQKNLEAHLKQMMGVTVDQNPDGTNVDGTIPDDIRRTIDAIRKRQGRVPESVLVYAACAMTQCSPGYWVDDPEDTTRFGYGLYRLQPKPIPGQRPGFNAPGGDRDNNAQYADNVDGTPVQSLSDASTSTKVMVDRLLKELPTLSRKAEPTLNPNRRISSETQDANFIAKMPKLTKSGKKDVSSFTGDDQAMRDWVEAALHLQIDPATHSASLITASKYLTSYHGYAEVAKDYITATTSMKIPILDWDNSALTSMLDDEEKKILKDNYRAKGALKEILPFLYAAKKTGRMRLTYRQGQAKESLYLSAGTTGDGRKRISAYVKAFLGQASVPKIVWKDKQTYSFFKIQNGVKTVWNDVDQQDLTGYEQSMPWDSVRVTVEDGMDIPEFLNIPINLTEASPELDTEAPNENTDDREHPLSYQALAQFSASVSFATRFAFPSNYFESQLLTGPKALINDVSCLDAIKQFCSAAMRDFMSMPDGRFLAFYPDYFGANRKPYWWVKDIEILDMGIQLNDENLATHVYVVGDVGMPDGNIDYLDKISSRGVVTLQQPGVLQSFINDSFAKMKGNKALGRLGDADAFINHFGARPYKEEQPIIRSGSFEFLYAYQTFMRKWAQQFATDVSFTFQPEIMAGGLIGFPDHDIQMYVEGVRHSFSYTDGFNTDATLSAPAIIAQENNSKRADYPFRYPGFAIAGNGIGFGG